MFKGCKTIDGFKMNKHLGKHLSQPGELVGDDEDDDDDEEEADGDVYASD